MIRGRLVRRRTAALLTPLPVLLLAASLAGRAAPPKDTLTGGPAKVQFNRDIRPILSDNCYFCHGPDKNKRQAGLRLDIREAALAAGAFVPGDPDRSRLVTRVFSPEAATRMPPPDIHKTLTPAQKNLLRRWIAQGAPYEAHWAYVPPRRPAVPALKGTTTFPVRNPIDAFILSPLVAKGIAPSPGADRRTLLRRVSLDLTGLPPTPEEVAAFLADRSPNAYEKVVDRLLASPRYGERMAVPWLDAVRYADTVGFHGDQNLNAWAYRDWVIDAFNRNEPFDQFTVDQLAGDLLPHPTPGQLTATAFNRLNMVTREGGAQAKEYLAKYAADRVRTVGMAWMGSTLGCCECHDHKYDPFTQRDFYSLAAFFADVQQWGVYADYGYTPNSELKGYDNDSPFPPEVTVASRYLTQRLARQRRALDSLVAGTATALRTDAAARSAYADWRGAALAFLARRPDGWAAADAEATVVPPDGAKPDAPKPASQRLPDGSVTLTDDAPATVTLAFRPDTDWTAALRVEALPTGEGGTVFRKGSEAGTVTLSAAVRHAAGGKDEPIAFRHAGANLSLARYDGGSAVIGVQSGWRLDPNHRTERHVSVWLPAQPVHLAPGDTLVLTFPKVGAARLRVSASPFVPEDPSSDAFPPSIRTTLAGGDSTAALRGYLLDTGWNADAFARATALEADILACRGGETPVVVTRAVTPAVMRVLPRGNWQDESGPVVTPAVPHFLTQPAGAGKGERLTRLDLARWLVSPQNPLTARVYVNRLWAQFFGAGISGLVEDLGAQGEWPTHPELLDWLAVEFETSGWNVKHLVRLLVTSSAYRQSSNSRPGDPGNRLLARQNPRRLEAEFVRDNALAIVGLLNVDEGGPPVKPYQPAGYYANIQFPDREYVANTDEREWRRGVYVHRQRTFLHPMLANFDAPSREDAVCTRTVANTPQQALTLLNDPTFVEAARVWAAHLLALSVRTDAERIDAAYIRALARPPHPKEKAELLRFLTDARAAYRARPDDAKKLVAVGYAPPPPGDPVENAAWTTVCRVLLNLHETITRY